MPLAPGVLAALLAAAEPADRLRERAAAILAGDGYQTALPPPIPSHDLALPLGPLELLLRVLLWTAFGVVVVLAATWLVRRLAPSARDDAPLAEAPPAAPPHVPIAPAEALAAEGRYGEAIHALLLETLAALSRAARLAPSLTSREIVARVRMPAAARDALSALVDAVEVSWFGGAAPGEADYRRCLDRFRAFLDGYRSAA